MIPLFLRQCRRCCPTRTMPCRRCTRQRCLLLREVDAIVLARLRFVVLQVALQLCRGSIPCSCTMLKKCSICRCCSRTEWYTWCNQCCCPPLYRKHHRLK